MPKGQWHYMTYMTMNNNNCTLSLLNSQMDNSGKKAPEGE